MTDEELKELAKLECAKLLKSEKGYSGLSFQEFWAEGYKKGLAEGKPKWHNLMNDPNDLPAERQLVLCYTSDPWCHNQKDSKNVKHCDVEMGTYMGTGEWYIGC